MKKMIVSFVAVFILLSCEKNNETATTLPANIQAMTFTDDCSCEPYIKEYKWRGVTVFLKGFAGPACNWTPAYYDKNGNTITMANGYTLQHFIDEAHFIRLIWKC